MPIAIMIVEDELLVAEDLKMCLERSGYRICAQASSGEVAVRKAAESHPDLILMDIILKGKMNGIEAAREIKKNSSAPIVFLTAHSDQYTLNMAASASPGGYVLKPFNETILHIAIKNALGLEISS